MKNTSLKEIIFALVESIDLVNYLLKNHHKRVAVITYELCKELGVDEVILKRAVLAAAVHDLGALYVKERNELVHLDINNPHPHAIRGAILLKEFNYFEEISDIILHHHRAWDNGRGKIFMKTEVPVEAFIIHLADRVDILYDMDQSYYHQKKHIKREIIKRAGNLFMPVIVEAFIQISERESFWLNLENANFEQLLLEVFKDTADVQTDLELIEEIAKMFSRVVDNRSPYTASHSRAVGEVAFELSKLCGLKPDKCEQIKIAGYLHDIGKLGIPNEIIEKDSQLTSDEYQMMKSHAFYTHQILNHLKGFEEICKWASMHHEKHDGNGYPFHIKSQEFTLEMDILAVADIFTALSENRPYRQGLTDENILVYLNNELRQQGNERVMSTLIDNLSYLNGVRSKTQTAAYGEYNDNLKQISQLTDLLITKKTAGIPRKSLQLH